MGATKKGLCSNATWQQYRLNDTDDHINRYLQFCRKVLCNSGGDIKGARTLYPKLTLASGAVLNIQAGKGVESIPNENNPVRYTHIEVYAVLTASDARIPSSWSKYIDKEWTGAYARYKKIPVDKVNEYIEKNGGFIIL